MYIIAGKYKKKRLSVPKTEKVRPTTSQVREALFNICQHDIQDAQFLDIFAGSGAMGLEALSREAAHVTFIEQNRLALTAIKKNIAALQVESQTTLYACDVFKALQQLTTQFDIIYMDPPYGENLGTRVLEFIDGHHILHPQGRVFIEESHLIVPTLNHLQQQQVRKFGRSNLYEFIPIAGNKDIK